MQPAGHVHSRRDPFFALAAAYLILPGVIFLLGWIRPVLGIPAAVVVVIGTLWAVRPGTLPESRPALSRKLWFGIVALAGLWTVLTGVGGLVPQSADYLKHNLLFHDLATLAWPVIYHPAGGDRYLCYGLGWYLVPALGGRLLGAGVVPALAWVWTFAGLILFFYWAATFAASPIKTLLAVLLFSTTGVVWLAFKRHGLPGLIPPDGLETRLLNNGLFFNYNDSFTRWNYQPQHALTGWLGVAVLLERLWRRANPRGVVLVWSACLLWSPLTCLGLLIIPLAVWRRVRWQGYFEPANVISGGLLAAVLGIYFQGHLSLAENGWIWAFSSGAGWLGYYLLFLALTLSPLLFMALLEQKHRALGDWRPLFFAAAGLLVLLPLYKMGFNGDLRLEASGPALLLLALAAGRMLEHESFSPRHWLCRLWLVSLLLGAVYPVTRPWINLFTNRTDHAYSAMARTSGFTTLADLRDEKFDAASQYQGRADSVAARWLLR